MKTGATLLVAFGLTGMVWAQDQDRPAPINRHAPARVAAPQRQYNAPVHVAAPRVDAGPRQAVVQPRTNFTAPNLGVVSRVPNVNIPRTNFSGERPRWTPRDGRVFGNGRTNLPTTPTIGGVTANTGEPPVDMPQSRHWHQPGGKMPDDSIGDWRNGQNRGDWQQHHNGWQNRGDWQNGGNWRDRQHGGQWNGDANGTVSSWADACRHYDHHRHDRGWWRNHYPHIVLIGGGYYYWNAGWWYPAWGYDSYYTTYVYDGPIYGGDYDVSPEQTIADVQAALRTAGYYFGAVDGQLGPLTRQAIAAWQRDHGLAVTTVVDRPTLRSLGF